MCVANIVCNKLLHCVDKIQSFNVTVDGVYS